MGASLGHARAVAVVGTTGHVVDVEAHIADGLPAFTIVGLPDTAVSEARERVRAALSSCGRAWRPSRTTVNLAPASLHKHGTGLDLALAVSVLGAAGDIADRRPGLFLGELGLDGRVQPVRGVLPAVLAARDHGLREVVVPAANAAEARLVGEMTVRAVEHLADVVVALGGEAHRPALPAGSETAGRSGGAGGANGAQAAPRPEPDMIDVIGQAPARRAVEVAAAGGHHLLLLGPPGAGKSMLAARMPGLLPDLDDDAALEVTAVHSVAGTYSGDSLVRRPPFEEPHHTATAVAIVGGGSGLPRPGAASRAHRGVLLLDESPEFPTRVLDTLRQPLETGEIVLHRAAGSARFPARFQLVLTANPCPCGNADRDGALCTCSSAVRSRYLSRLSGPLLDRVDLQVQVARVSRAAASVEEPSEPTAVVARRVAAARTAAADRLAGTGWSTNAEVPGAWLRERTGRSAVATVADAVDTGRLTMRGMDRVLRVAWSIADLAGADSPSDMHVGEAMTLRSQGPRRG
ncbi:YifB family Mg chelatase-like AAA ATPase [Georgenia sp. Z1344]|uniref:YifB family Mg chelatase-like AAA ATPase n=1 Tax=Georgenia sp. Z1344 TaxID=3416706 RepID=UPI003CF681E9